MIGKRKPQHSFFDVIGLPHRVSPDSFYGRMGKLNSKLLRDDDLKEMYCPDNGRPSLPPSMMAGIMILEFYDDVSDAEAAERVLYDLRWKVALNLPMDDKGFDPSSLSVFRTRLVEHKQERYAFDRLLEVAREEGFLADKVTLLSDTTNVKGAGATQDTYTLLRKGTRKLLKAMGYHLPGKRQGCLANIEKLLATYVEQDRKAEIDWSDPAKRNQQLKALVTDSEATLELALQQIEDPEVRSLGWMISKILSDDVEQTPEGNCKIARGTAPDRFISLVDTEMRHGRKSASKKFDGHKVSTSLDQKSELILDVEDLSAPLGDGQDLLPAIKRVEEKVGVTVERIIVDGAYGSGGNRAACAERPDNPVDLLSPMRRPNDPEVDKSAFNLNNQKLSATCPKGQTVPASITKTDSQGRTAFTFVFDRTVCESCPLFTRCVRSKTHGRTVSTSFYEDYLRAARLRQQTDEFKQLYRPDRDPGGI
ncbi:MAG: transposase [Chloroflexi bacterium]|nr:transposase [Chloroflexota bacterium]